MTTHKNTEDHANESNVSDPKAPANPQPGDTGNQDTGAKPKK